MGKARTGAGAIALDSGALIALERADDRIRALCREALRAGVRIVVPAPVLAQVWREGRRQAVLAMLLKGRTTEVAELDAELAKAAGVLCGRAGTSDIVDACLALVARQERAVVVTGDAEDMLRLDPGLPMERV
ncbi:MAG TPA: PIN domain-containing protein [Polyangiaceae bacterium]|jgi:rRNA-processing protein FCF1